MECTLKDSDSLEDSIRRIREAVEVWIREPKVLERFQQQIREWSQLKVEMEQEDKDLLAKRNDYASQNWNSEAARYEVGGDWAYFLWRHPYLRDEGPFRVIVPADLTARERLGEDANQVVLPPTEGKPLSLREQYVALAAIHDSRIDDSHRELRIDPWKDDTSCRERWHYGFAIYDAQHMLNDSRLRTTAEEPYHLKGIESELRAALKAVKADIKRLGEGVSANSTTPSDVTKPINQPASGASNACNVPDADSEKPASKVKPASPAKSADEMASSGTKRAILVTLFRLKATDYEHRQNATQIAKEPRNTFDASTVYRHTKWLKTAGYIKGDLESGNSGYWLMPQGKKLAAKLSK